MNAMRKNKNLTCNARGRRSGQALIEMALVISALIMLTMGIIQYGIVYNATTSLTNITREGARYAAVKGLDSSVTDDAIKARVVDISRTTPVTLTAANVTITPDKAGRTVAGDGTMVTVTVSYNMRPKLFLPTSFPGLSRFSSNYTTTGSMLIER